MIQSRPPKKTPPSSSGPGRGPLKAKTGVRVPVGASDTKSRSTDDVERFLSMLRFDSKGKLGELPHLDLNLK
jgi:hypothetical protein